VAAKPKKQAFDEMNRMMQDQLNHKIIWEKFTNRPAKGKLYEGFVREQNLDKKHKQLLRFALDSDDALIMSKEYLAIRAMRGDESAAKHLGGADSALTYGDYSESGTVDHTEWMKKNGEL